MNAPQFRTGQSVSFVGGTGTIKSRKPNSGRWIYVIEMPLGEIPMFGRIGAESSILLIEADLQEVA